MPCKISFIVTWLIWLSHCIIFQIKERKQIGRLKVCVVFCKVIFFFNQSKHNAVLKPRTGNFRGLAGFEAKAKDLKLWPRGRPRRLHQLWFV